MQELDDMILKRGDIVDYYTNNYNSSITISNEVTVKRFQELIDCKITKIQRPIKYETIYETSRPILDKEEKEYLEAVLKPFRDKIRCIVRSSCFDDEFIYIVFNDRDDTMEFPLFEKGTMYKGMEIHKKYTLEELGLFEEE